MKYYVLFLFLISQSTFAFFHLEKVNVQKSDVITEFQQGNLIISQSISKKLRKYAGMYLHKKMSLKSYLKKQTQIKKMGQHKMLSFHIRKLDTSLFDGQTTEILAIDNISSKSKVVHTQIKYEKLSNQTEATYNDYKISLKIVDKRNGNFIELVGTEENSTQEEIERDFQSFVKKYLDIDDETIGYSEADWEFGR